MSSQHEFARSDKAFEAKLSGRACPVCGRGELVPLRADFVVSPSSPSAVEPIDAVGQVCVRCGFLALHASKYLLDEHEKGH